MNLPFIDLKAQYAALKPGIDARIQRVLDHGQYIMGPEVKELETALAAYTGAKHCITSRQRHRGAADCTDGAGPEARRRGDHNAPSPSPPRPR